MDRRHTFMSDGYYAISGKENFDDQDENYCGATIDKLAYYENLEEEGRLIILSVEDIHPCKSCNTGWGRMASDGAEFCYDNCEKLNKYNEKYNLKT